VPKRTSAAACHAHALQLPSLQCAATRFRFILLLCRKPVELHLVKTCRHHYWHQTHTQEVEKEVDDEKRAGKKRKVTEMEYLFEAELEGEQGSN